MAKPIKFAVLCSISALLAACGSDGGGEVKTTVLASRMSVSTQALTASSYYDVVQHIYVGYFGRPADAGGLAYFAGRLKDLGAPTTIAELNTAYDANAEIRAVIDIFGTSEESEALYAGDNAAFVEAVYRNLFGRAAEAAGKAWWVERINEGRITRASAAVRIMAAAQTSDRDVINKKTAVAGSFTAALDSPQRTLAYDGLAANVVVRNMLGTVTLSTDTASFQQSINSTLNNLVTQLGAQGMYAGRLSGSGYLFNSLILEDGQYWGFYSHTSSGYLAPSGFLQGQGSPASGVFSAADVKDFGPVPASPGSMTANYTAMTSLNGSVGVPTGAINFTSTGLNDASYRYNTPAKISELQGSHRLSGTLGAHTMTIGANGAFSASTAGCNYSGNLTPRASGKNVYNVSWTFGAGSCPLSGQSATGVAFSYLTNEGASRQIVIAVTNAGRTVGTLAQGAVATAAGKPAALAITDNVVGTGPVATPGSILTVHYTGWLYNAGAANLRSTKFDSSRDSGTPFQFYLGFGQVIQGWDQGVAGMRVGGKRTLVIPASLGYGVTGSGTSIPSNAGLVFEVELLGVR